MSRKKSAAPPRDGVLAELATTLPEGEDELLETAASAVARYDQAVVSGDDAGATVAAQLVDAVVWKLNGGTMFGCKADEDAAGCRVDRFCAAPAGAVPRWGQRGEFLVKVAGVRAVVEVDDNLSRGVHHFAFHAIDPHALFISETGYRSHFTAAVAGSTVDAVARGLMAALVRSEGKCMLSAQARTTFRRTWSWLDGAPEVGVSLEVFEEDGGQLAFGF
jgi:hypothetical protein